MNVLSRRAVTAVAAATLGLAFGLVGLATGQSESAKPATPAAADGVVPEGKAVSGGRVIAKGQGYSIEAASGAASAAAAAGQTTVTDAPLEILHEPIVCRGERVLNIDNRNIRFDGNAITADDGCELHITNSRISAGGIAIRARNASVHIENSEIEGHKAAIDASGGAQIYVEASTFEGAARRLGQAAIHDLGNNAWD
jgi:parallel beta helix pectate lyase-like protein